MLEFKGLELSEYFDERAKGNMQSAQDYIDTQTIKYLEDYTPIAMKRFKNRGKMSRSHVVYKPGIIINTEPTARKEYYVNKGFSGPQRGKLWLERMKVDHKYDILKGLNEK